MRGALFAALGAGEAPVVGWLGEVQRHDLDVGIDVPGAGPEAGLEFPDHRDVDTTHEPDRARSRLERGGRTCEERTFVVRESDWCTVRVRGRPFPEEEAGLWMTRGGTVDVGVDGEHDDQIPLVGGL